MASCWLASVRAELAAAHSGGSLEQAAYRLRHVERAQRRYAGALRLLATLRAKLPAGLAPNYSREAPTGPGVSYALRRLG